MGCRPRQNHRKGQPWETSVGINPLGTKLRALYQRKKGRDLFDLAVALEKPTVNPARIVTAFSEYMDRGGHHITRALFEQKFQEKLRDPQFNADISPLLASAYKWDSAAAADAVTTRLIPLLPGDPWKGEGVQEP